MKRSRKTLFALLLALVMTLGLAATAWATGGDETDTIEVIPGVDPGTGNYPTLTERKIPFTKTVKLGGNTAPGETVFTIEVCHVNANGLSAYTDVVKYTATVTTTDAGDYDGELIIRGLENKVNDFFSEGFFVREVNDKRSGWTYSNVVWFVSRDGKIYPATMENGEDGEFHFREVEGAAAEEKMTFENTYTYNHTTQAQRPAEKPNTPETTASPKTFDAGVALYGVSALLSLTGTALLIKRKNG